MRTQFHVTAIFRRAHNKYNRNIPYTYVYIVRIIVQMFQLKRAPKRDYSICNKLFTVRLQRHCLPLILYHQEASKQMKLPFRELRWLFE